MIILKLKTDSKVLTLGNHKLEILRKNRHIIEIINTYVNVKKSKRCHEFSWIKILI